MLSGNGERDAGGCRGEARQAGDGGTAEAAEAESERDTGGMKGGGREDEADREARGTGGAEFTAMGVAVEQREEADDGGHAACLAMPL